MPACPGFLAGLNLSCERSARPESSGPRRTPGEPLCVPGSVCHTSRLYRRLAWAQGRCCGRAKPIRYQAPDGLFTRQWRERLA